MLVGRGLRLVGDSVRGQADLLEQTDDEVERGVILRRGREFDNQSSSLRKTSKRSRDFDPVFDAPVDNVHGSYLETCGLRAFGAVMPEVGFFTAPDLSDVAARRVVRPLDLTGSLAR